MIKLHLARRLNHHMGGTHSPGFFRSFLLPFGTSPIARLGLVLLLGNLYFYLPFYALYLQSLGLDLVQISELSILLLISTLLFEIPGGMLADHLAKKKILVAGFILQLLGEVLFLHGTMFFHFVLASLIGGIHWALHSGCLEAYLYELLHGLKQQERYNEALGYFGFAKSISNFIAFLSGTLIVGLLGASSFSFLILLTVCSVALALGGMITLPEQRGHPSRSSDQQLRAGSKRSLLKRLGLIELSGHSKTLLLLTLLFCVTQPLADSLLIFIQPFFEQRNGPVALLGTLIAAGMVCEAIVLKQVHVFQKKFKSAVVLKATCLFLGLGYILLAWSPNAFTAAVFFLWIRSAVGVQQVLLTEKTLRLFSQERHATVLSMLNLGSRLYVAGGMWGIALVAEHSLSLAFVCLAILMLAASITVTLIKIPDGESTSQS